jgi:hypothetical protein
MSRLWPHPPFAEDQPSSHSILYTHVLTRAFQAGSMAGADVGTVLFVLRRFGALAPRVPPRTFMATVLRSTGVGAVVGTGLMAVALPLRMRDQEEIQWQDRSWRLLENQGQVECDDWTYGGMALGAVSTLILGRAKGVGLSGAVGRVGMGSILGTLGYLGWRYGVNGGKREHVDAGS